MAGRRGHTVGLSKAQSGKSSRYRNTTIMARIESVSVATCRVPLTNVTAFATRTISARDYGLVKVKSKDGTEGMGFCYAGSTGGTIVAEAVEQLLAPILIGQDSHLVEGLRERMFRESLLHGRAGSVMRAISILDCALWDLNARAAKLPLCKYLGAFAEDAVPAYASGGYYPRARHREARRRDGRLRQSRFQCGQDEGRHAFPERRGSTRQGRARGDRP
jgi:L-alanine-DL-glutamate epimerase-like enolase superfamily enzyme